MSEAMEVGKKLVELCHEGKYKEAMDALLTALTSSASRLAPAPGGRPEWKGLRRSRAKANGGKRITRSIRPMWKDRFRMATASSSVSPWTSRPKPAPWQASDSPWMRRALHRQGRQNHRRRVFLFDGLDKIYEPPAHFEHCLIWKIRMVRLADDEPVERVTNPGSYVAHALVRAASRLLSTPVPK